MLGRSSLGSVAIGASGAKFVIIEGNHYLQFDGVNDYVSIPKLQSENDGGYSWSLEFRSHNSNTDEFIVLGSAANAANFLILRNNNKIDYRINGGSKLFDVSDVTNQNAVYRLDWEIDTLSVYQNNVFITSISVSIDTPIGGNTNDFSLFGLVVGADNVFRSGVIHYLKYTDNNNSLNNRFYKKESLTSSNDTVFTDIINGNNGTLKNFATDNSQWVFYEDVELTLIIDNKTNINQQFLSANIHQQFLSANINQKNLSNNFIYH